MFGQTFKGIRVFVPVVVPVIGVILPKTAILKVLYIVSIPFLEAVGTSVPVFVGSGVDILLNAFGLSRAEKKNSKIIIGVLGLVLSPGKTKVSILRLKGEE